MRAVNVNVDTDPIAADLNQISFDFVSRNARQDDMSILMLMESGEIVGRHGCSPSRVALVSSTVGRMPFLR
jgi:hypothetical protein